MKIMPRFALLYACLFVSLQTGCQLPSERISIHVSHETLQKYVGTYELRPGARCYITLEGDQLLTQLTGQAKFPLFAETETKFFLKIVDAQVEFMKDKQGRITHIVHDQNGQERKWMRISDSTPPERKAITVAPDILKQYVGTYPLSPAFAITVTLEGGQLITQATGQQKFPIYPESENKFFPKAFDAQIEFVRDANGVVTSLILHQGGRDQHAPKR